MSRSPAGATCRAAIWTRWRAPSSPSPASRLDGVREAEVNPLIVHAEGHGVTVADAWIMRA
jgi:hypothetical protein